jgi:hypothetical protein
MTASPAAGNAALSSAEPGRLLDASRPIVRTERTAPAGRPAENALAPNGSYALADGGGSSNSS